MRPASRPVGPPASGERILPSPTPFCFDSIHCPAASGPFSKSVSDGPTPRGSRESPGPPESGRRPGRGGAEHSARAKEKAPGEPGTEGVGSDSRSGEEREDGRRSLSPRTRSRDDGSTTESNGSEQNSTLARAVI